MAYFARFWLPFNRHSLKLLLFVLVILWFHHSFSQSAVGVLPPAALYMTQPGERVEGTVTVSNPNNSPLTVRVYVQDWHYLPDGTQAFVEPGSLPGSASDWITFSPSIVTLEGRQHTTIRYTVDVPGDAAPGTHWSMLFMEGENPNPRPGESFAVFSVRVGHTIYMSVPPVEPDGMITGIFGIPPEDSETPYRFAIQYTNTGNAAYAIEGVIEFRDASGETVVTIDVDRLIVLPGATRMLMPDLYGPLDPGPYTMLTILNYGDRTKDIAGDYTFFLEEPLEVLMPSIADAAEAEDSP